MYKVFICATVAHCSLGVWNLFFLLILSFIISQPESHISVLRCVCGGICERYDYASTSSPAEYIHISYFVLVLLFTGNI